MTYPQYPQSEYGAQAPVTTTYATWIQRVGASLIDSLITAPFSILAVVLGQETDPVTKVPSFNAMYFIFLFLGMAVYGYNRWYLQGKTGQSWGKKVVGLKLVKEATGQPIGFGMAFVRDLLHIVDSICFIGYLFPLWDAKKQTISDKIVSTIVLK
jgi:uncharacterized RDD family membrane protein YckC